MKLFISGEIDGSKVEDKIGDKLRDVLHDVEPKINSVIGKKSYGTKIDAIISIQTKLKKDFDGEMLIHDILDIWGYEENEITNIRNTGA